MEIGGLADDFTNYEVVEQIPTLAMIQELQEKVRALGAMLEAVVPLQKTKEVVDLSQLAAQVMPGVVRIEMKIGHDTLFQQDTTGGVGTGFVIAPDGYIVTNHHMIDGARKIKTVFQNSGIALRAEVIGSDPETDIAVIKVDAEDLAYLQFVNSDPVKVGERAVLIGNPLGFYDLLSAGIVSGKSPNLFQTMDYKFHPFELGAYGEYVLTDMLCNPGNSGGPLVNMQGDVIGVCAKMGWGPGGGTGMNIASNTAAKVVEELMANGYITRASLGAQIVSFEDPLAPYLLSMASIESVLLWNDGYDDGLIIGETIKGSAASLAGLQKGDILVQYNDIDVTTPERFFADLAMRIEPHSTLKLSLIRSGELIEVLVPLDARKVNHALEIERLGIRIEDLDAERTFAYGFDSTIAGLLVTAVEKYSDLHQQNLRPGDVITGIILDREEIQLRNIEDVLALEHAMEGEHDLVLIVRSHDRSSPNYFYMGLYQTQ